MKLGKIALASATASAWFFGSRAFALPPAVGPVMVQQSQVGAPGGVAALGSNGQVPIAQLPIGTGAGQVAAGNDSRITGAVQGSQVGAANGVAGLGSGGQIPTAQLPIGTGPGQVAAGNDARILGALQAANNLGDLNSYRLAAQYLNNTLPGTQTGYAQGAILAAGAQYPVLPTEGWNPAVDMPTCMAAAAPIVDGVGDSTMASPPLVSPLIDSPGKSPIDAIPDIIKEHFFEQLPHAALTFNNRGIPGKTWNDINNIPTNYPSWAFDTTLPWLAYVQADNPMCIFWNSGINDANGFSTLNVRSVFQKVVSWGTAPASWTASTAYAGVNTSTGAYTAILDSNGHLEVASTGGTSGASAPTWPTTVGAKTTDGTVVWDLMSTNAYVARVPDFEIITNKNANLSTSTAPFNTTIFQTGVLNAASFLRTGALSDFPGFGISGLPPVGLIDIGRYFTEAYNGYDPVDQRLTAVMGLNSTTGNAPVTVPIGSFPYTLPSTAGDFDLQFTVNGSDWNSGSQYITVTTGAPGNNATSNILFRSSGTTFWYQISDGSTGPSIATYLPGDWAASGTNTIEIVAKNGRIRVAIENSIFPSGLVTSDGLYDRFGAYFAPAISLTNPVASPLFQINEYMSGTPQPTAPLFTSDQAFGGASTPWGGNSLNHGSSWSLAAIDKAVIDNLPFFTPTGSLNAAGGTVNGNVNITGTFGAVGAATLGAVTASGRVTANGGITTPSGGTVSLGGGLSVTGGSIIFQSATTTYVQGPIQFQGASAIFTSADTATFQGPVNVTGSGVTTGASTPVTFGDGLTVNAGTGSFAALLQALANFTVAGASTFTGNTTNVAYDIHPVSPNVATSTSGTGYNSGTLLTSKFNKVTTCTAGGVSLNPSMPVGSSIEVYNRCGAPFPINPDGASDFIESGSAGASVSLAASANTTITRVSTTQFLQH